MVIDNIPDNGPILDLGTRPTALVHYPGSRVDYQVHYQITMYYYIHNYNLICSDCLCRAFSQTEQTQHRYKRNNLYSTSDDFPVVDFFH